MDSRRFDTLVRSLSHPASRRGALGGMVGALALLGDAAPGLAKHRHKKKPCPCKIGTTCGGVTYRCCSDDDCLSGKICEESVHDTHCVPCNDNGDGCLASRECCTGCCSRALPNVCTPAGEDFGHIPQGGLCSNPESKDCCLGLRCVIPRGAAFGTCH